MILSYILRVILLALGYKVLAQEEQGIVGLLLAYLLEAVEQMLCQVLIQILSHR